MEPLKIDESKFKFQYLPDFANFILKNKLEEFVTVSIRYCREENLPMLRTLASMPEKDLIHISIESNRELLTALAENNVVPFIKKNIEKIINNDVKDKDGNRVLNVSEILVEDIILAFFLRRKTFAFFLHAYTQNAVLHTLLMTELDVYTTQEHLLTSKTMVRLNSQKSEE
ncbi:MAG: hypothetical protein V4565_01745 [Bacteroidota bacterium]